MSLIVFNYALVSKLMEIFLLWSRLHFYDCLYKKRPLPFLHFRSADIQSLGHLLLLLGDLILLVDFLSNGPSSHSVCHFDAEFILPFVSAGTGALGLLGWVVVLPESVIDVDELNIVVVGSKPACRSGGGLTRKKLV